MFLYVGPEAVDLGMSRPTLTDTELDQWAQSLGNAVIDRGAVFGSNGASVLESGRIDMGGYFIHGYSIVQADDIDSAITLTKGHPFLSRSGGQDTSFEIQILDFTSGSRPLAPTEYTPKDRGLIPDSIETRETSNSYSAPPQQPQVQQAQQQQYQPASPENVITPTQNPGELQIQHGDDQQDGQGMSPGGTLPPPKV